MGFRALGLGGLGFKPRELQAGVKDLEDLGFGLESRLGFRGLGFRVLGLGLKCGSHGGHGSGLGGIRRGMMLCDAFGGNGGQSLLLYHPLLVWLFLFLSPRSRVILMGS